MAGESAEPCDLAIVTVRIEQIDEALTCTRPYLGPNSSIAVLEAMVDDLTGQVRSAQIDQPLCSMLVAFGAWPVGSELHWFRFPGARCMLCGEGTRAGTAVARQLAKELYAAGLRTSAQQQMPALLRVFIAEELALYMAWELADWDIDRLAADRELCTLTSRAMADAIESVAPANGITGRLLAAIPAVRAIWRYHGPKIAVQTRYLADALIEKANQHHVAAPHLRMLRGKLSS